MNATRLNKQETYNSYVVLSSNTTLGLTGSVIELQELKPVSDVEQLHRFDTKLGAEMAIKRLKKNSQYGLITESLIVVPLKKTLTFQLGE